jgi:hypothetical protein
VPLVRGRAALVRVLVRAKTPDVRAPTVTIALVDTATGEVVRTVAATSPLAYVPLAAVERALGGSWNVVLAPEDVQPGRHLVATLGAVEGVPPERVAGSLRLPADGSLDVRAPATLGVTIVPVVQSGLVPDVARSRTPGSWLERARFIHPLAEVDVQVAAAYETGVALGPDGAGWGALLAELDRKRVAEGSGRTYLGAVRVGYTSGVAGRAGVAGQALLAWDGATYQRVAAHELGHTFGLRHAPCGPVDATTLDPTWPDAPGYAGARTGVFGWDPLSGLLKDPAVTWDHMGYCGDDASQWTSDHNYRAALAYLTGSPAATGLAAAGAAATSALVSGAVRGGAVELDPAYVLDTRPTAPAAGEWAVELLGRDGAPLAALPFAPVEGAGEGPPQAHFALAVPLPPGAELAGVVVRRSGLEVARRVAPATPAAVAPAGAVSRDADGATVRWDRARHAEAMVRDARTGEVLAFGRGGALRVRGGGREVEVLLSDGVRTARLRAPGR